MAIHHHYQNHSSLLDALYCEEEEQWEEEGEEGLEEGRERDNTHSSSGTNPSMFPLLLLEHHDLFWEDEELLSLFSKEQQTHLNLDNTDSALSVARKEAVEWILKVNACYGFTPLTAILAINYLDRFLSGLHFQREKPWMIQLLAVTCLSLAAKVEETQVPLLLDLQVSLQWRMNPVTPISFLDHIMRRLGLKTHLHWEFLRRCEKQLLSLLSDARFVGYLPSVLAASTMLHVIQQVEPCHSIEYQNQLLGVLNLSKEKVSDCYELILEVSSTSPCFYGHEKNPHKRKYEQIPSSPSGVIDAILSSDSSNDSWAFGSVSSSPEPLFKKSRSAQMPSLNRVFVDAVGSPH
ncbi:similar to CYCLIN D3;2 [Actinidia rufa]|uniref:Similar to CYCLIN D32 n=1 Tax=Actinidia rufa TaxID=165716 RepID=A0A7J0DQ36_9ERIC|nr:similar to CYCLIN D3;2 [Actinidia rufa]